MHLIALTICLSLVLSCTATISGPYLLWGHEKVNKLQPEALVEADTKELPLMQLFKDAKAIVIFVRNSTNRLEGTKYPRFQNLVKTNAWSYLPQRNLAAEPFNYNANIEVINLSGHNEEDDAELLTSYNDALSIYGHGEVLGILASREEDAHYLAKRDARGDEEVKPTGATTETEETEASFIYVAEGNKAVLHVTGPPELRLGNEVILLEEHTKQTTFDDQHAKGYGRLSISFRYNGDKCMLRFKFSLSRGTWHLRNVEVEYKEYKDVLVARGDEYTLPSAPLGFSYRCSAKNLTFINPNKNETLRSLHLVDYQVQPWLNGGKQFGDVYDCVGFVTAPILAGLFVVTLLIGILGLGITAMLSMHTPNRFESSRNKQLTFTVQE